MTLVVYEPDRPAMEFIGHAGAGLYGQDPVCAALSILMYTLIEAVPDAALATGDGYCRIDAAERPAPGASPHAALRASRPAGAPGAAQRSGCAGEKDEGGSVVQFSPQGGNGTARASSDAVFALVRLGVKLLAESFPHSVRLEVKT